LKNEGLTPGAFAIFLLLKKLLATSMLTLLSQYSFRIKRPHKVHPFDKICKENKIQL